MLRTRSIGMQIFLFHRTLFRELLPKALGYKRRERIAVLYLGVRTLSKERLIVRQRSSPVTPPKRGLL
jgi:hypothetical protein